MLQEGLLLQLYCCVSLIVDLLVSCCARALFMYMSAFARARFCLHASQLLRACFCLHTNMHVSCYAHAFVYILVSCCVRA
jgi:hypothetical protein